MDPALGAGIGAAVGGVASAFSSWNAGRDAKRAVDAANTANKEMMWEDHVFQETMSSTAYQRAVRDMRNAGLNPAVMMQGAGGAASSPHGGSAVMQSGAEQVMASGLERSRAIKDLADRGADIELKRAMSKKALEEAKTSAKQGEHLDNDTKLKVRQQNREDELTAQHRKQSAWESKHVPPVLDAVVDRVGKVIPNIGWVLGGRGGRDNTSARRTEHSRDRGFPRVPSGPGPSPILDQYGKPMGGAR